ncbi:MAG: hypothetical protein AAB375_03135 [Patescibacteria group bacterium]
MTNENPPFDPEKTNPYIPPQELERYKTQKFKIADLKREIVKQIADVDPDLINVVAELPGGIKLHNLKFRLDLSLSGTDENGVDFSVPFDGLDDVTLRPK